MLASFALNTMDCDFVLAMSIGKTAVLAPQRPDLHLIAEILSGNKHGTYRLTTYNYLITLHW